MWQRHRGQFQIYVTVGTKQGLAPVVRKGMNTLAFFCFCFCTPTSFWRHLLHLFFRIERIKLFSTPPFCHFLLSGKSSLIALGFDSDRLCFVSTCFVGIFVPSVPAEPSGSYCFCLFYCFIRPIVFLVLLFYRSYFVGPTVGSSRFDKGGHCVDL